MRLFEIVDVFAVLVLIVTLFRRLRARRNAWELCLAFSLFFIAKDLRYAHWQLIPLYLAVLVMWFASWVDRRWPQRGYGCLATISLSLVCATIVISCVVPMFHLPKPTGPYVVGTQIFHLVDQGRNEENGPSPSGKRELMVQAWYPAELPAKPNVRDLSSYQRRGEVTFAASYRSVLKTNSWQDASVRNGGPYPVLIYNPGWMGERTEGTFQMEELASHGFVVVAVDHNFFGGRVQFPDGRVTDSRNAPDLGNFEHTDIAQEWTLGGKYVGIEAADGIFALNQLERWNRDPASPWFQRLDLSRVGASGFSIGGAVAVQMAEMDPRVKAAVDLDGWIFGDFARNGLAKPMMVIYEDRSRVLPTQSQLNSGPESEKRRWQFSVEDFDHVNRSLKEHGGTMLFVAGTEHVDFTDRSLFSPLKSLSGRGTMAPQRVHAIANAYTLAFFLHALYGQSSPLLEANPSPFSGVDVVHY